MEIKDSVAVVVGGASGMARASAELLASLGAKVAILDLENSKGAEVAASMAADTAFFPMNILDSDSIGAALSRTVEKFGAIHIGVNTAGGGMAQRTLGRQGPHDLDAFKQIIDLNLTGSFDFLRQCADKMVLHEPNEEGERGVIINTASIAAYEGQIGQVAYASAKAGITGMTFVAARDLGSMGIRCLAIAPSLFQTGITELVPDEMAVELTKDAAFPRRMGKPEEYAKLVKAMVENPMLNGSTIRLDAGQRFAPK